MVPLTMQALQRRHGEELQKLQSDVERCRLEFNRKVEAARVSLLAEHAKEEQDFWNKQKQQKGTPSVEAAEGPKGKVNGKEKIVQRTTAAIPMIKAKKNLPKSSITNSQQLRPGLSARPPQTNQVQKETANTVIDLCSDSEDDTPLNLCKPAIAASLRRPTLVDSAEALAFSIPTVTSPATKSFHLSSRASSSCTRPEFSIPSTYLELFGENSKKYWVSDFYSILGS